MARQPVLDRKACSACARAKRKCGKETPRCSRCEEKDLDCDYPARRPCHFVLLPSEEVGLGHDVLSSFPEGPPFADTSGTFIHATQDETILTLDSVIHSVPPPDVSLKARDVWFLSPDTWKIRHPLNIDVSQFSSSILKRYPKEVHRWLSQWVSEGANPFIHRALYQHRFPRCVQDAYMALSLFTSKTSANEEMVYRILQDRAEQLIQDNVPGISPGQSKTTLDTFDHLARVHSLIVYQVLGLFDGDIRLRHLAEQRIPLLFTWADEMLDSASQVATLASFLRQMTADDNSLDSTVPYNPLPHSGSEEALWRAWVLAESVRRTWGVASGILTVYLTLQRGWAACAGGTMVTTRRGVWEAASACTWAKLCTEVDVGFMHREQTESLLEKARVEDVDIFARVTMEATFGWERMERWGVSVGDRV